ncbi:MAG: DUF1097 domain-containing protein [Nitrosomonadales bacterium]|nr:DUF1097 domain-containing protein [Nitrosomonadales bacterium]
MNQLNATTFCAFALTAVVLYLLSFFTFIPPWAVFIAWACFFHMDGGLNRNQAYIATLLHLILGAFSAWISALAVLNNPFGSGLGEQLWAPVFIGIVIALLSRMGTMTRFCVTPAVIYGYASVFAFASTTGFFSQEPLLSMSFNNALLAVVFSFVLGASAGYLNAMLVGVLIRMHWISAIKTVRS